MIFFIHKPTGNVVWHTEYPEDAKVFMWGRDFLEYDIYVSNAPLPFESAEIYKLEAQICRELGRQRTIYDVATFKDFNGQVRLFNVWYPMPFLANIKRGESTFPYCTIPTPNQPLRSMLFWLGTDGKKYHAESNVWTQDLSKTHWGVFNEGWYEI